jgi:hypothetical protein
MARWWRSMVYQCTLNGPLMAHSGDAAEVAGGNTDGTHSSKDLP